MKIKTVPYCKIEDGRKLLVERSDEENRALAMYESMIQQDFAWKVREDRREKFANPAILLGLKNDGIR